MNQPDQDVNTQSQHTSEPVGGTNVPLVPIQSDQILIYKKVLLDVDKLFLHITHTTLFTLTTNSQSPTEFLKLYFQKLDSNLLIYLFFLSNFLLRGYGTLWDLEDSWINKTQIYLAFRL